MKLVELGKPTSDAVRGEGDPVEVAKGVFHVEAGTTAMETGIYRCLRCGTEQVVREHERIPVCRHGHTVFEHRTGSQQTPYAGPT